MESEGEKRRREEKRGRREGEVEGGLEECGLGSVEGGEKGGEGLQEGE